MKIRKLLLTTLSALFLLTTFVSQGLAKKPVIEDGKKVELSYALKVDGILVEERDKDNPLQYTHGSGQLIPGLSKELAGLKKGKKKKIVVEPQEGYGAIRPELFRTFLIGDLPEGFNMTKGAVVSFKDPSGQVAPGTIWYVENGIVTVNFNHPMAGKTLEFSVKILSVE